jgi:hypothetical protein
MPVFHTEDHAVCGKLAALPPDDNNDVTGGACFVYVGTGGDLNLVAAGDTAAVVLKNVPTGSLLPLKVARVKSTSTTATNLVAVR